MTDRRVSCSSSHLASLPVEPSQVPEPGPADPDRPQSQSHLGMGLAMCVDVTLCDCDLICLIISNFYKSFTRREPRGISALI